MSRKIFIILAVISIIAFGVSIKKYFNNKSTQDIISKSQYEGHIELNKDNAGVVYMPVVLKGKFLHQHTIFVYDYNKPQRYIVLTPYQLHDNSVILVARGLTSCNLIGKKHLLVQNSEVLFGYSLPSQKKPFFSSYADTKNALWFCINTKTISNHINLELGNSFVVATEYSKNIFNEHIQPVQVDVLLEEIYGHSSIVFAIVFLLVFILSITGIVYYKKNE